MPALTLRQRFIKMMSALKGLHGVTQKDFIFIDDMVPLCPSRNLADQLDHLDKLVEQKFAEEVGKSTRLEVARLLEIEDGSGEQLALIAEELRKKLLISRRISEAFTGLLATQTVIEHSLLSRISAVKSRLEEETKRLPKTLTKFAENLYAEGLTSGDLASISSRDIQALVAFLKDYKNPEAVRHLSIMSRPSNRVTPEKIEASIREAAEIAASPIPDVEQHIFVDLVPDLTPHIPTEFGDASLVQTAPVPREFWSAVQTFQAPFVWEYRAATPADKEVLEAPLPFADTWDNLKKFDKRFAEIWPRDALFPDREVILELLRTFLSQHLGIPMEEVSDYVCKLWAFLLVGRNMDWFDLEENFQDPAFFDGMPAPCPCSPDLVRVLKKTWE